jgi:hypothetical protein
MRTHPLWFILILLLAACLGASVGCVTAKEGRTTLRVSDDATGEPIDDCLLLSIRRETLDNQGHAWVIQAPPATGGGIIRRAAVQAVQPGQEIHQAGNVVMLWGPYASGKGLNYEYWLMHPGYQGDRFYDTHLLRAYEQKKPLERTMLRFHAGVSYSDETVLDAARAIVESADWLDKTNPLAGRLLDLAIHQTRLVRIHSIAPHQRDEAADLLDQLRDLREAFPAETTPPTGWIAPPPLPAEPDPQPEETTATPTTQAVAPPAEPLDKVTPQPAPPARAGDAEPIPLPLEAAPSATTVPARQLKTATLSFRLAPINPATGRESSLTDRQIEQYMAVLEKDGPTPPDAETPCRWIPCEMQPIPLVLITAMHKGQHYALLSNRPGEVMQPVVDGRKQWGLTRVTGSKDNDGKPAVLFHFDEAGAHRFEALTGKALNKPLAIIVNGRVVSAPIVMSVIRDSGMIVGQYTPQQVAELSEALKKGMVEP